LGDLGDTAAASEFRQKLEDVLSAGGRQVKSDIWHDPRSIIVHDVEIPIPLYYFPTVVGDIEQAYRRQAADEKRSYSLHIDFNWEKSLPNLNPRDSELDVDWSLAVLARGLSAYAIERRDGEFVYTDGKGQIVDRLGENLTSVLYHLAKMPEKLKNEMKSRITDAQKAQSAEDRTVRNRDLAERLDAQVNQMYRLEMRGELTREDLLDRPIFNALVRILNKPEEAAPFDRSGSRYDFG
jgi:hypothetical protein